MAIDQRNDVQMYIDEAGIRQASQGVTITGGSLTQTVLAPTSVRRIASSPAGTNATSVKSASGRLYMVTGYNANASARFLKIYNKASAPTVGTDVPVIVEYLAGNARFEIFFYGLPLSSGISFAITTGVADTDTGGVDLADITAFNLVYD